MTLTLAAIIIARLWGASKQGFSNVLPTPLPQEGKREFGDTPNPGQGLLPLTTPFRRDF